MKILDCKNLRDVIEENVKEEIDFYSLNRKKPSLCVIMVGNDPASEAYVKNKKKAEKFLRGILKALGLKSKNF